MDSRKSVPTTPLPSPRSGRSSQSGHSAATSLSRTQVRPRDYISAVIRLIVQESGGDIEVPNLRVTVQGCFGHTDLQINQCVAELTEHLTMEHSLPVEVLGSRSQVMSGTRA
eukprot:6458829-Amphidinium_carterae.1